MTRVLRFIAIAAILMIVVALALPAVAQTSYRDATGGFLKEKTFVASAAYTATKTDQVPIDAGAYDSGNLIINVTNVGGTDTPTLTVMFDVCADATATKCVQHTATTGLTGTGLVLMKVNQFARYVRVSYTISGTNPTFTFSVYGVFKPYSY